VKFNNLQARGKSGGKMLGTFSILFLKKTFTIVLFDGFRFLEEKE
jgi:hypothetical protein